MSPHRINKGIIERYRDRLPVGDDIRIITLYEGDTPLIPLENIPGLIGKDVEIYAKFEGLNPTGSFKDRGMTMAVTQSVLEGSKAIICASTGNTSAAAAAYASRAGIKAFVLIPDGKIAQGKLAQAMMKGAIVIQIQGNFDDGMRLVKEVGEQTAVSIVNSINPYRIHGQKTIAFEIVDTLGRAPDYHCLPVGNAGNITAHWLGYCEYAGRPMYQDSFQSQQGNYNRDGIINNTPVMCGYQASGSAPFLRGHPVKEPETVATAIRIGNPQSWDQAWTASKESNGWFDEFSDEEILATQKLLAEREGIFCEPASAVSLAGAIRDLKSGKIPEGSMIVCTLTGHGLKDPDTAIKQSSSPVIRIEPELDQVKKAILDNIE
jgi:threonine synthase